MRIVQLIDSLEAGGAERMAVNYANALTERIEFSGLGATRGQGYLKFALNTKVSYLFLGKTRRLELAAARKLYQYCRKNEVGVLHAHSTSIFLAVLIKIVIPNIKIVWHDHYGNSKFRKKRPSLIIKFLLICCAGAIAVNSNLEGWIKFKLSFKNVLKLANFVEKDSESAAVTVVKGIAGKRIICLANLRQQKNHIFLLKIALKSKENYPDWTFHFVGKEFNDTIAQNIKSSITDSELMSTVFLYGSCTDTAAIIEQCEIGVLSSHSEGLPLSILEYGLCSKAVVATNVGEVSTIIRHKQNGFLVHSNDENEFYAALEIFILDSKMRTDLGLELNKSVIAEYSKNVVIGQYINWIQTC